ncbi:MAG: hypothetical protein U0869_07670 [Chloroflexota bacterium]
MPRPAWFPGSLLALALAGSVVAACGSSAPDETAPPPTPLPELSAPAYSLEPTDSPDASLRPTFDADAAAEQLLASVPEAIAPSCTREPPGAGAMAELRCTPSGGTLDYQLFEGPEVMLAAYEAILDGVPANGLEGQGCGKGPGRSACRTAARRASRVAVTRPSRGRTTWSTCSRSPSGPTPTGPPDRLWTDAGPVTP